MERRKLREQEHKFKLKKINKKWVSVGLTTLVGIGIIGLSENVEASASEWRATTVEEMKQKVKVEDGKYTFELGDTFYAIGEAINIKPAKLMELNGFQEGSQYSVPIGTTIYWSGDNVTVKDAQGNVIAQETIKPADKVNPSLPVGGNSSNTSNQNNGSNVKGNTSTNSSNGGSNVKDNEENSGSNNGNNGGTVTPTPTPEPSKPEKPQPEQSELEKLRVRLAELKAQLEVAKQELAQAEQELATAKSDTSKSDLEAKISEQQTLIDNAQATITTKQAEVASIDSQISVANTDLNNAQSNLATVQSTVNNAQSAVATAQANLATAKTALEADPSDPALQQAVNDATNALSTANSELSTAQANVSNAQAQVTTAQSTIDSLNSSKAQANSELETAQNTLTTAQNEKANLEQQLNNISNTDIPALEAKVKEKAKVVADLEAEIAKVEKKIAELEGQEKPKPPVVVEVDKSGLQNLVNSVKATDLTKYTDESVKNFNTALSNANSILGNKDATQEQVNSALSNLQSAFNNLVEKPAEVQVDKSALQSAINQAQALNQNDYTQNSYIAVTNALKTAQLVMSNSEVTQVQVDEATTALTQAISALELKPEIPEVEKGSLHAWISIAEKLDLTAYTDETAQALTDALNSAVSIRDNANATQSQVDEVTNTLRAAYNNLEVKPTEPEKPTVEKSVLETTINSVKNVDTTKYTEATVTAFTQALTNANSVLENNEATQSEVDSATQSLQQAFDNLELKNTTVVNKDALDQAITKAPSEQGSYTDTSWKALQSALSEAKKVSGKEDATQSEVDTATTALSKAINDLKVQKYTLTVIHKDSDGKVLDTEEFQVEKGKNYQAKSKGFEGYELVGEGTKTVTNMQADGTITFTYKKQKGEEEAIKEVQDTVNKGAIDIWNDYRGEKGKTQAYENETLQKAADLRAKEIVEKFDHTRPNGLELNGENKQTGEWGDSLAEEAGYFETEGYEVVRNILAENIAKIEGVSLEWIEEYGATFAMESWKNSTLHNRNLLLNDDTIPVNQFAIGSYITKNADGTYNVYYVGLVGYDYNLK